MKRFVIGHIDWNENELRLEIHLADSWQTAVAAHSKYPWRDAEQGDQPNMDDAEAFKQTCFDCDCQMSWIEV